MPFVITGRSTWSLGAIIALLVLIACFVFIIVGGVSQFAMLLMIGALALAVLIG